MVWGLSFAVPNKPCLTIDSYTNMENIIVLDTVVGIVILTHIKAPWWAYLLLLGFNLIIYLIGDERGWFDK